jgi:hypothetical protein
VVKNVGVAGGDTIHEEGAGYGAQRIDSDSDSDPDPEQSSLVENSALTGAPSAPV